MVVLPYTLKPVAEAYSRRRRLKRSSRGRELHQSPGRLLALGLELPLLEPVRGDEYEGSRHRVSSLLGSDRLSDILRAEDPHEAPDHGAKNESGESALFGPRREGFAPVSSS